MAEFVNPPLRRHASLQPFSRDHHLGLVQARRLIRSAGGTPGSRRGALAEFLRAWEAEIAAHFRDEERLLLPLLPPDPAARLLREHAALTELAAEARALTDTADPGAEWVRRVGELLEAHIRWEERDLFPLVERTATPAALDHLARETAVVETSRARSARR